MNQHEMNPHVDPMGDRIEAYLDGDLTPTAQAAFEQRLAHDADLRAEVLLARRIQQHLRVLPAPVCPPRVTQAVLAEVRTRRRASLAERIQTWVEQRMQVLWQPALAMSTLLLLVLSAALLGQPPRSPANAEVEEALAEVRWTLAYLSEVGRQTGSSVREEVLAKHVVSPVQDALDPFLSDEPTLPPAAPAP